MTEAIAALKKSETKPKDVRDARLKLEDKLFSSQDAIDLVIYNSSTPDYSATNEYLRKFAATMKDPQNALTRITTPNLPISPFSPSVMDDKARKSSQILFYPSLNSKSAAKNLKTNTKMLSKTHHTKEVRKTFLAKEDKGHSI